ncbi:uncharacterized protein LOC110733222 [Chenopodium quinoa]|uniref:uncharacterized protein LOC110733222 n=1 Tax=Chenopodium quinoa TaxID=63459 RepID=UPI000B78A494|nr:uncharacterized protein LOC110733222 [Chenopodium quinoa]
MSEGDSKRRRSEKLEVSKGRAKTICLEPGMFKDDSLTCGGAVKSGARVMVELSKGSKRIFYLDRLDRDAVDWDVFPRVKAWNMQHIRRASKMDKMISGDFGRLGVLDVAYGEQHPRDARDSVGPLDEHNVRSTYLLFLIFCSFSYMVMAYPLFSGQMVSKELGVSVHVRQRRGRTA